MLTDTWNVLLWVIQWNLTLHSYNKEFKLEIQNFASVSLFLQKKCLQHLPNINFTRKSSFLGILQKLIPEALIRIWHTYLLTYWDMDDFTWRIKIKLNVLPMRKLCLVSPPSFSLLFRGLGYLYNSNKDNTSKFISTDNSTNWSVDLRRTC